MVYPNNAKLRRAREGYTIIYEHNPSYKGDDVTISFAGGASFDNEYPGITHLIEHLFFRGKDEKEQEELEDFFQRNISGMNCSTSASHVLFNFACSPKSLETSLNKITEIMMKKDFSQEQINKEIDIIAFEDAADSPKKDTKKDDSSKNAGTLILDDVMVSTMLELLVMPERDDMERVKISQNILGNPEDLKARITPDILRKYKEKYFNKENLIVSVVSNKSIDEIESMCENAFERVPHTLYRSEIAKRPNASSYARANISVRNTDKSTSNVSIAMLLRERTLISDNIYFEKACDLIEDNIMYTISGLLFQKLRLEKQLVYLENFANIDLYSSKFKAFSIVTNKEKAPEVLQILTKDIIGEFAKNGISKKKFYLVKSRLLENMDGIIFERPGTSYNNLNTYFSGYAFVNVKKLREAVKKLSYEEFNEHIKKVYSMCNLSYAISGDIDINQYPNTIDLQNMTGIVNRLDDPRGKVQTSTDDAIMESTPIKNNTLSEYEQNFWNALYEGTNLTENE